MNNVDSDRKYKNMNNVDSDRKYINMNNEWVLTRS